MIKTALVDVASVSSLLTTIECVIVELPKGKKEGLATVVVWVVWTTEKHI